ncbi:MAG: chromosomal replication initiator protein DnaA [Verrucomicrobiota bacterium]
MSNELFFSSQDLWQATCNELKKLISPDAFSRWFMPLELLEYEAGKVTLGIENSIYQYWIEENYLSPLQGAFQTVLGKDVEVTFRTVGAEPKAPQREEIELSKKVRKTSRVPKIETQRVYSSNDLVPRYTFDTFVVGLNNQFAHAACLAVSKAPARTYNPLFIHGSVGLGKTHLMHAIGHSIIKENPLSRIVYVTSEQFTNEFVSAIQHGELAKFRKRFRRADALLIDDVQFFAGKDRSQEEFFHTFNALFDGNKQIVLTSDCPPSDVNKLENRLVSRFEWGLTAELQPPDIETRLAILRSKATKLNIVLGDSILLFIAERVKANIRRLEGALNRVAAWAALNDRKITQEQVEDLLKDFIQEEAKHIVTIDGIQRKVAESFDIRMSDMSSKRRPNNIAIPRMIAMYLSRRMTSKSLQDIGECFGGRDHGTVLHAVKTVEDRIASDANLRQQVHLITQQIESGN